MYPVQFQAVDVRAYWRTVHYLRRLPGRVKVTKP